MIGGLISNPCSHMTTLSYIHRHCLWLHCYAHIGIFSVPHWNDDVYDINYGAAVYVDRLTIRCSTTVIEDAKHTPPNQPPLAVFGLSHLKNRE